MTTKLDALRAQLAEAEAELAAEEARKRKPWHAALADLDDHKLSGPAVAGIIRNIGEWLDQLSESTGVNSPLMAERASKDALLQSLSDRLDQAEAALATKADKEPSDA